MSRLSKLCSKPLTDLRILCDSTYDNSVANEYTYWDCTLTPDCSNCILSDYSSMKRVKLLRNLYEPVSSKANVQG